jgi:cytosine/adenosine deaminase-related metal-dependent hydrolase
VLGREDIGSIETGKCADFFAVNLERLEYAGAAHDPASALVFCQPRRVDYTAVGGRWIVKEGNLATVDEAGLVRRHNRLSRSLLET